MSSEVATASRGGAQTGNEGETAHGEGGMSENANVSYQPPGEEVIYVQIVEKCNLHETALNLLMEIFQTKSKGVVLGSSELMLRTIHIIALGLRGVLRQSMNEALSTVERVAKGAHVGLQASDIMMLMLPRCWRGAETKQFREKYSAKFHMTWDEYRARQNAPDPAAVAPEEIVPDIAVREVDDDYLFSCA